MSLDNLPDVLVMDGEILLNSDHVYITVDGKIIKKVDIESTKPGIWEENAIK